jgi:lipoprotein NlpI
MLPIEHDPRVPMMQIYELYRGKLKPEDVLKAAEGGNPDMNQLNQRLFYAHLYIGLWHEAGGRAEEARKHILEAEKHKIAHYMWDVAHVHAERLRAAEKK